MKAERLIVYFGRPRDDRVDKRPAGRSASAGTMNAYPPLEIESGGRPAAVRTPLSTPTLQSRKKELRC